MRIPRYGAKRFVRLLADGSAISLVNYMFTQIHHLRIIFPKFFVDLVTKFIIMTQFIINYSSVG